MNVARTDTMADTFSDRTKPARTVSSVRMASYQVSEKPPQGSDGKRSALKENTTIDAIGARMNRNTATVQAACQRDAVISCLRVCHRPRKAR